MKLNYQEGIKRITNIVGVGLTIFFAIVTIVLVINGWPYVRSETVKMLPTAAEIEANPTQFDPDKYLASRLQKCDEVDRTLFSVVHNCYCESTGILAYYKCHYLKYEMVLAFIAMLMSFPLVQGIRLFITYIVTYVRRGFLGTNE